MLATISIGRQTCVFNGDKWDCDDSRLKRRLNSFTVEYETYIYGPSFGDPLLATVYAILDAFGGVPVTLPPPEPSPGQGAVE